jgi:anti-anti-sigma factor
MTKQTTPAGRPTPASRADLRHGPDGPIITVIGEFDLANADELRDCFEQVEGRPVVVDMSSAEFMDSTILGVLIAATRNGSEVTITGAKGQVRRVLTISGLAEALHVQTN